MDMDTRASSMEFCWGVDIVVWPLPVQYDESWGGVYSNMK